MSGVDAPVRPRRPCGERPEGFSDERPSAIRYFAPASVKEAIRSKRRGARIGFRGRRTDLYPNMKRRQQNAQSRHRPHARRGAAAAAVGTSGRLDRRRRAALRDRGRRRLRRDYPAGPRDLGRSSRRCATWHARRQRAARHRVQLLRNRTHEWRQAIDFCMKKDGTICWVAPGSPRCLAIQSADSSGPDRAVRARRSGLGRR